MILLLLKTTLALALGLAIQSILSRASAAMRHLVCLCSLVAAALMPLTLFVKASVDVFHLPYTFEVSSTKTVSAASPTIRSGDVLMAMWAVGSVLILARLVFGYWRVGRLRSSATLIDTHAGIPVFSADITVPVAVGLSRPAILLPIGADEWPDDHRVAALRHEEAHIKRKDLWTNALARAICALYWFHPLAWAVARRLGEEQELASDDAALAAGTSPYSYAEALLTAARFARTPAITTPIGCQMITHKALQTRISRLVNTKWPRRSTASSLRRVAVLAFGATLCLALMHASPQTPSPEQEEKIFRVGPGITAPRVISKMDPEYTEEARAGAVEGTVVLRVVIGTNGKARHINVVQGLDGGLDLKAAEAIQKWQFQPAYKDGEPVDVHATIEVNFKLK